MRHRLQIQIAINVLRTNGIAPLTCWVDQKKTVLLASLQSTGAVLANSTIDRISTFDTLFSASLCHCLEEATAAKNWMRWLRHFGLGFVSANATNPTPRFPTSNRNIVSFTNDGNAVPSANKASSRLSFFSSFILSVRRVWGSSQTRSLTYKLYFFSTRWRDDIH